MGKPTGFMEYTRAENEVCAPLERIKSFDEFKHELCEEERRKQGARCMNCGVPFCQSAVNYGGKLIGCPLHNLIPEWNDEVCNGNYTHALDRLLKTNNFPEFTGRVCPALCERACINGKYDTPVTVHENELFIIETAFRDGKIKPKAPALRSGKKVAVIGSGPAGLACADQLNHRGHSVTVYEKADRVGGLLMYGIPNMKLDKSIIERRVKLMKQEGVRFITGMAVGIETVKTDADEAAYSFGAAAEASAPAASAAESGTAGKAISGHDSSAESASAASSNSTGFIPAEELMKHYDAVVLCCGAEIPRPLEAFETLKAEGVKTDGVYYAMEYLTAETKHLLDNTPEISAAGLNVIVVGAGDTANDCIGTAVRQGAASVTQLIRRAKSTDKKPVWPEYDENAGLGYGQEEAIALYGRDIRVFETGVKSISCDESGRLTGVQTVKLKRGKGGYEELKGSEEELKADLLIIASGFAGCDKRLLQSFGAEPMPAAGQTAEHRTDRQGLFTAGDMRTGASLVVRAIAEGRDCASQVDEYLLGYRVFERL